MFKRNKRKGFTLVELLVVIAIIAILATVSVVGFISLTKKAKESNDTAVLKQINDLLLADETLNDKPTTEEEAFTRVIYVAEAGGYLLENLTPMSEGDILYDLKSNRCLLVNLTGSSPEIVYQDSTTDIEASEVLTKLQGSDEGDSLYFIYATTETVDDYKCLYQKVDSSIALSDAFSNSKKGIVVDSSVEIEEETYTLGNTSTLTLYAASGVNQDTTAESGAKGVWIKSGKIFRITEGTTVTIKAGTTIVHDGQILLYGTLILETASVSNAWYVNYYKTADAISVTDSFVIKSTGYLSMVGSGAGGFRTVTAEEGAQVNDGVYVWRYNGEGWVAGTIVGTSTSTVNTNMAQNTTQGYVWRWVITDATEAGTSEGGHWEYKSLSDSSDTWHNGATPYGYTG